MFLSNKSKQVLWHRKLIYDIDTAEIFASRHGNLLTLRNMFHIVCIFLHMWMKTNPINFFHMVNDKRVNGNFLEYYINVQSFCILESAWTYDDAKNRKAHVRGKFEVSGIFWTSAVFVYIHPADYRKG